MTYTQHFVAHTDISTQIDAQHTEAEQVKHSQTQSPCHDTMYTQQPTPQPALQPALQPNNAGMTFIHPKLHGVTLGTSSTTNTLLNLLAPLADFELTIDDISRGARISIQQLTQAVALPYSELATHTARLIYTWIRTDPTVMITSVEPWRYGRRLQALRAAGMSYQQLCRETSLSVPTIDAYITAACQHAQALGAKAFLPRAVTPETLPPLTLHQARCIVRLYMHNIATPVTTPDVDVPTLANNAGRAAWPLPFCWDNIDDPNEQPGVTHCFMCENESTAHTGMCQRCHGQIANAKQAAKRKRLAAAKRAAQQQQQQQAQQCATEQCATEQRSTESILHLV